MEVAGAFRVVDGQVQAWNLDGSPAPSIQLEVTNKLSEIVGTSLTSDQMKRQLEQAVFAVADVVGEYAPGDVMPAERLGFYVGMMSYPLADRHRLYVGGLVKPEDSTFAPRFLLRLRPPVEKTVPFVAGSSFKVDAGTVTLVTASSDRPTEGRPMMNVRKPTGHFILTMSGLPEAKMNMSLLNKAGKQAIMADSSGTLLDFDQYRNFEDISQLQSALMPLSGKPERQVYAIFARPDQIGALKVTVLQEETVDRKGVPTRPRGR